MTDPLYPPPSPALTEARKRASPETHDLFQAFARRVYAGSALPSKTKQIIAVAVAHATQCPYCISGHTKAALNTGATSEEIMEAIWVAAEMRAGAAYAHSLIALAEMQNEAAARKQRDSDGPEGTR